MLRRRACSRIGGLLAGHSARSSGRRVDSCAGLGSVLTPLMTSNFGLVLTGGIIVAAGSGAASFSVLIGTLVQGLPAFASRHGGTPTFCLP